VEKGIPEDRGVSVRHNCKCIGLNMFLTHQSSGAGKDCNPNASPASPDCLQSCD